MGPAIDLRAEAGLFVDEHQDLVAAHAIAVRAAHDLLHSVPQLIGAVVHISPAEGSSQDHHDLRAHDQRQ